MFSEIGFVDLLQVAVAVRKGKSVVVPGKTFETPVPRTAVELVCGGSLGDGTAGIEPIQKIPVEHAHFSSVSDGAKMIAVGGRLTLKKMLLPGQPCQDLEGLVALGSVLATWQFRGDLAMGHYLLVPEAIAGSGDCFAFL